MSLVSKGSVVGRVLDRCSGEGQKSDFALKKKTAMLQERFTEVDKNGAVKIGDLEKETGCNQVCQAQVEAAGP